MKTSRSPLPQIAPRRSNTRTRSSRWRTKPALRSRSSTTFPGSLDSGARVDDAELVVTIGGDGTLLRGVRLAVPLDVPILGVNTGRLGFLTEIETTSDGMAGMRRALRGDFVVEERLSAEVSVNGSGAHFALNDVVVRRGAEARMAPFGLALDGEPIAHIPSDGIVRRDADRLDRVFSFGRRSDHRAERRRLRRRGAAAAHALRATADRADVVDDRDHL